MGYETENLGNRMLQAVDSILDRPTSGTEITFLTSGIPSDFDRIFYLPGNLHIRETLLLFSKANQRFIQVELAKHPVIAELKVDSRETYEEIEVYDHKLFCVRKSSLALDVFFSSKKRLFFHKRTFHFKNKNLEFKEQVRFIIWKHGKADTDYRCLLGPLKDGRFMNFSLRQKSFSNQEPTEQWIDNVFFVSLALESEIQSSPNILAAFKPDKNTILCFDNEKKYFFEYGELSGHDSLKLETINLEEIQAKKLNRMYLHYPYDHYPNSLKNKIKSRISHICPPNTDIEKFARNRYKEILLCMEGEPLYIMHLVNREYSFGDEEFQWDIRVAATGNQISPVDITIDEVSGTIYALCYPWIYCLKPKEKKDNKAEYMRAGRESKLMTTNWKS